MRFVLHAFAAWSLLGAVQAQSIYGVVGSSPGVLGTFSTATGTWTPIGSTSSAEIVDIEFSPDGTLYALKKINNLTSQLLTIDPATAVPTSAGLVTHPPGNFTWSDMAFAPTGELYVSGFDFATVSSALVTIDVQTASVTAVILGVLPQYISGIAVRSDGKLFAVGSQSFVVIDPANGQTIATLPNTSNLDLISATLTSHGSQMYLNTGWFNQASTHLASVDPFTGTATQIGLFGPWPTTLNVMGLAGRGCYDAVPYCTAGTSGAGCVASLASSGSASVGASAGFVVSAQQVEGQRSGMFFYGISGKLAQPFGAGVNNWLCVRPPVQRTSLQSSGGGAQQCNGTLSLDWLAWTSANPGALGTPLQVGTQGFVQAWYRSPAGGATLSDALHFLTCP